MTTSVPSRPTDCSDDQLLAAIGDRRRRLVVAVLDDAAATTLSLQTVTDRVADRLATEPPLSDDDRHRLRSKLHHVHLPKLADCSVIDHDSEARTVRLRTDLDR